MSPSPKKVQAIRDYQAPTFAKELESTNWPTLPQHVYYSTLVQPMREHTKQDVPWQWGGKEEKVLDIPKKALTCETTMTFFDPKLETDICVVPLPYGLGGILTQRASNCQSLIMAYACHFLTDPETRYSLKQKGKPLQSSGPLFIVTVDWPGNKWRGDCWWKGALKSCSS